MTLLREMTTVMERLQKTKKRQEKDKIVEEHRAKLQGLVYDTAPTPLASGASETGSEGDAESDIDYDACICGLADSKLYQGTTTMENPTCRFCCETPHIQDIFKAIDFRNKENIPYWMKDDFLQDPWKYDLPAMSAPICSDETICIPDDVVQHRGKMHDGSCDDNLEKIRTAVTILLTTYLAHMWCDCG